jgi:hypothetical protein
MITAAAWLWIAILSVYLFENENGRSVPSRVILTIGAIVVSASSVVLIIYHALGDISVADLVAIVLLTITISVYIRAIWLVNSIRDNLHD